MRPLDGVPHNLPAPLTSFIGRTGELAQIRDALAETRLLTLTGAGGVGKTRLALRVAADLADRFAGGTWWVDLAPMVDRRLVAEGLADALGVRALPMKTALDTVCERLSRSRALVILDNCEHLLGASAEVAETLLRTCPDVGVLATSRIPLGVPGESDWRVPPMSLPALGPAPPAALGDSDAARLFIERARKARASFAASEDNAAAVAQICRELDGLPLAIELAAARVRMMSAEQIAAGLGDRFRLLTGGTASSPARHQTLRGSVDWSHELLTDRERVLLRRLAVFAGGFTLDLAEAVCADAPLQRAAILDLVASLVEKSLVVAEERAGAVRYRILETVREYALERLVAAGEIAGTQDRHRDAMLALAERAAGELHGPAQREWLAVLDHEAANLAAAIDRAADTDADRALRLCVALTLWWKSRGLFAPAERAFARALDGGEARPSSMRAHALWGRGYLAAYAGRIEAAVAVLHEACAMAESVGDESALARALMALGFIQQWADPVGSRVASERARDLARACGDDWTLITSYLNLAFTHLNCHEVDAAERLLDEILPLTMEHGYLEAQAWHWLGKYYEPWGAADNAVVSEFAQRSLAFSQAAGEPTTEAIAHGVLAHLEIARGEPAAAAERMHATRDRALAAGAGIAQGWAACWLALAQASLGEIDEARPGLEQAVATGMDGGFFLGHATVNLAEILRVAGDTDGAATRAREALAIGQRASNPSLTASANETLGRLAAEQADWANGETLLHDALTARCAHNLLLYLPQTLDALAQIAAGLGSHEEAARTLGAAHRARADLGLKRWAPDEPRVARLEQTIREALGEDAYELAHRQGRALALDEAVAWIRRARGERKRPDRGWESLTPTELRVARLVADGLTNPQIGERMFIARATVKAHLAHIFSKLDVSTRAELATEVTRRARR